MTVVGARILKSAVIGAAIETPLAICLINSRIGIDYMSASGFVCFIIHVPAFLLFAAVAKLFPAQPDPAWAQFLTFITPLLASITQGFLFSCIVWLFLAWRSRRQPAK